MDTEADNAIQFSLRDILSVTTYIAASLAVVSYSNSVPIGIHLSLALIGWIMWRYAHGHLGGIIPALLGGDILLGSSVAWVSDGSEDFMGFREMICMAASLFVLTGLGVFVWIATRKQRFWRYQIGIAVSIFIILIAWWSIIPTLGNAAISRRQASDNALNNVATTTAIAMVEKAQACHGKTPDRDTLRIILSGPLPSVHWNGYSQEIQYQQTGEKTFQLSYIDPTMFMGDIVVYDSGTPNKGWYRIPF